MNICCTSCGASLVPGQEELKCSSCQQVFKILKGIPDFRSKDEYWCNVDRSKMERLIVRARESNDWLMAAKEIIPEYHTHFSSFDRADCQFLWPINENTRVLDAGSMWGGLTLPVAQFCHEVYAVDKTVETLQFLKTRAQQMGLNNIKAVAASLRKLPFADNHFDFIILNGVLEWVAFEDEVILEKHFGKKRENKNESCHSKNPREMQSKVLQELKRVLKPGGSIYIAIENAIGYTYLMGQPDNHVNLPFVSFLPRWLANLVTKVKLNSEYRTYVYSPTALTKLIKDSGFTAVKLFGAFNHYHQPLKAIPFELIAKFKSIILTTSLRARLFLTFIPKFLIKFFSPSILAIANKPGGHNDAVPRLVNLLVKAGVILPQAVSNYSVVYNGGRSGTELTSNYLVFDKTTDQPIYFCKISRAKERTEGLQSEVDALKFISEISNATTLKNIAPQIVFYGQIEGITFLVTNYIKGQFFPCKPRLGLMKRYVKKLNKAVISVLKILTKIQLETKTSNRQASSFLLEKIKRQKAVLEQKGFLTKEVDNSIAALIDEVRLLDKEQLFLCLEHGDLSFYNNILFERGEIGIVDFEHLEKEELPFLDLATLIFVPILISYERKSKSYSFLAYLNKYNLKDYILRWLELYSQATGLNMKLLRIFHKLAVLEQNTRVYPSFRNLESFPLYGKQVLLDLLSLEL